MKKILIVGTHQSGSTRLFNLVRLLYEAQGLTVESGWDISPVGRKCDVIVSKVHDSPVEHLKKFDVKFLPLRNVLDAAMSRVARWKIYSYPDSCMVNINLYKKFQPHVDMVVRYEDFSIFQIQNICNFLKINNLTIFQIIEIMKKLDDMHTSKNIVKIDDNKNDEYKKTLLSQAHNTSNGKNNKFINIPKNILENLFKNKNILNFLKETKYV